METLKASSTKFQLKFWAAIVLSFVMACIAFFLVGLEAGRVEGAIASSQRLPASPQLPSAPLATNGATGGDYTLTGVFFRGNQIAGTTNFSPSDIVSGDCRLTKTGQGEQSLTLFQDLGDSTGRNNDLLEAYAHNSVIQLSNTRLVPGDNPYIVSDARIVPQGVTAPFPAYLEVKQAKFRWALPGVDSADGKMGDPLIVCNYA
jgi:hypothetical protein